jgi:hypothetical protein
MTTATKGKAKAKAKKKGAAVQQRTTKLSNGKAVVVLPEPYQLAVNAGILKAAKDYSIDLKNQTVFYFETQRHYNGNRKLQPKSQDTYIQHYRQLWRHLAVTGDFESMLMLVSPEKNLPAMKVESLQSFMRKKKLPPSEMVTETEAGAPVYDCVTKAPFLCEGAWKCNMKLKQFTSAVARLHKAHNHHDHYDGLCSDCVESVAQDVHSRGCRQHAGKGARIFRRGDPTKDQDFLDVKHALVDGNYTVRGCDALSPKDVRAIRRKLLGGNSVAMLGAYTMILLATRIFLRSDEVLTIKMEHFIVECFVREGADNRIRGLCIKIWGKTDKQWKYYWLWVNDECPEFCSVRHLFVYLHLSGIRNGFLFPPWQDITGAAPPADGIYENHLSYSTFNKWFQRVLESVLPNKGVAFKTGLHQGPRLFGCEACASRW